MLLRNYPQQYVANAYVSDTGYAIYQRTPLDAQLDARVIAELQGLIDTEAKYRQMIQSHTRQLVILVHPRRSSN